MTGTIDSNGFRQMGISLKHRFLQVGNSFHCLLLCVAVIPAFAAEPPAADSVLGKDMHDLMHAQGNSTEAETSSFQLIRDSHDAGLNFDLGGSEIRKLQLQLVHPLTLSAGSQALVLDNGANLLGLDATLDVPLGIRSSRTAQGFSLTAGARQLLSKTQFQALGSIHCMNGILRPDSYTASGCQFVNESVTNSDSRRISLGARYDAANASASISWFTQNTDLNNSAGSQLNTADGISLATDGLLMPSLGNPLLASSGEADPLRQFNGLATGVDLDFRVGIATDTKGDIRLGLAFSHVLDADYQGIYSNGHNPLSWTLAEPFNSARMNLEWSRGNFSSGIRGFYREPINFLNRNSVDSLTTFDVHFTWRTPWNANLSVGASNVLNAGTDEAPVVDNQPSDPLESVYGRIPYVRYKQDL